MGLSFSYRFKPAPQFKRYETKMKKLTIILSIILLPIIALVVFEELNPSANINIRGVGNTIEITISPNYRANSIYDFKVFSQDKLIYSYKDQNKWPFNEPFKFELDSKHNQLKITSQIQYDYWIAPCITTETKMIDINK